MRGSGSYRGFISFHKIEKNLSNYIPIGSHALIADVFRTLLQRSVTWVEANFNWMPVGTLAINCKWRPPETRGARRAITWLCDRICRLKVIDYRCTGNSSKITRRTMGHMPSYKTDYDSGI